MSDQHTPDDVSQEQAEEAVRTLLRWAGEDPAREGLLDTPKRVAKAYRDWFSGYESDPGDYLRRTFKEVAGYDEMVVLRDIEFESHCEHHMAPIIGRAHVGYMPTNRVVGISKLARVVDGFARRFQVQEKLTAQIAQCIQETLHPAGVAVVIDASHECMTTRGVHKRGVSMITSQMLGTFRDDARTRAEFLQFIGIHGGVPLNVRLAAAALAFVLLPAAVAQAQDSRQDYLQQFDSNADHRVDEAEYLAYMSRGFIGMDANGDGVLEASELPGGRGREVTLRSFQNSLRTQFHKLDRNHDGLLNARELTAPPG